MKLAILGGGGFRVPLVYGALLARHQRPRVDEVVLHDVDEDRLGAIAPVLDDGRRRPGRAARLARPPTSTRRSRTPTSSSARSASGGLEGRVARRAGRRSTSACSARRPPAPAGLLRAAHRAGRCRARRAHRARSRPHAWFVNFTNPAAWSPRRCSRSSATASSASATRRSGCAGASPRALGRDPDERGSTTSASTTSAGCAALRARRRRPAARAARRRRPGSPASRRAGCSAPSGCARSGCIPNEYLYYYYFTRDTVGRDPRRRPDPRASSCCEQQRGFYDADAPTPDRRLGGLAPRARTSATPRYMAEARAPRTRSATRPTSRAAATRARRWRSWRRSPATSGAALILNVRNGTHAAGVPRRGGGRGAVRRRRATARTVAVRRRCRDHARPGEPVKAVERDHRGRADRLARAGREGARAAPAGRLGEHGAGCWPPTAPHPRRSTHCCADPAGGRQVSIRPRTGAGRARRSVRPPRLGAMARPHAASIVEDAWHRRVDAVLRRRGGRPAWSATPATAPRTSSGCSAGCC